MIEDFQNNINEKLIDSENMKFKNFIHMILFLKI